MKDATTEIILKEWEQRYESYRSYRGQYFNLMGIAVSGYILGMSFILSQNMSVTLRLICFILVLLLLTAFIIGHRIASWELKRLGIKIDNLENQLGMGNYGTVKTLQKLVSLGMTAIIIGWLITLGIILYFVLAGS